MGFGTFVHHIGTVLLLVATALLIVVSVTAPAVNSLAILRVELGGGVQGNEVTFGSFGYCHRGVLDTDQCSRSHIGYNPADVISDIDDTDFGTAAENTSKGLTRVMILHPIAAALCFIAFLLCLGTGIVGSLGAVFFALVSFIVTIVAMACDFAAFSIIRSHVNDNGRSTARWGSGIWCILAAAICTLFAAAVVMLTCCAGRAKKRRQEGRSKEADHVSGEAAARRPFWKRG
ncbi:SUR7/PalI family protein [Hirsutella rhossiliensis]|uniref:SUR7/PalI family domain-containing protein n=1 Tax=Hirsutella rhossiliensis TaxID=111463 RepID=A0A9P8MVS2_9HYPO|nr:SUR7/PalI family domain-containing protein [Hirsutella rhossiliensis]KAH0961942.1 SUR7/PalI family domain-containing protein [Hirsutella rhossiliensis]